MHAIAEALVDGMGQYPRYRRTGIGNRFRSAYISWPFLTTSPFPPASIRNLDSLFDSLHHWSPHAQAAAVPLAPFARVINLLR